MSSGEPEDQNGFMFLTLGEIYRFNRKLCDQFGVRTIMFKTYEQANYDSRYQTNRSSLAFNINTNSSFLLLDIEIHRIDKKFEKDYLVFLHDCKKWHVDATDAIFFEEIAKETD